MFKRILIASFVFILISTPTIMACEIKENLPDSDCTPGDTLNVTKQQVCTPGYSKTVRNVPEKLKKEVYASYGVIHHSRATHEVDHLIPLTLGGSNDIHNLWPQGAMPYPGFRQKDGLENRLRAMVCRGEISLEEAQIMISSNWVYFWEIMGKPADNAGVINSTEGQP